MRIEVQEPSLVLLVGPSGCGKSTFGAKHFKPTEVVSSDRCRGMLCDDESSLAVSAEAFDLLHTIVRKRLALGKLTVVDATNVQSEARQSLLRIARDHHVFTYAIVFLLPEEVCHERNKGRSDRQFGSHVVKNHIRELRRGLRDLDRDTRNMAVLKSVEQANNVEIVRTKPWTNRTEEMGPFDIVGDIHGCYDELGELLTKLGYGVTDDHRLVAPKGHRLIFLGDLVDRGPKSVDVLKLAMNSVEDGTALCIPGNHDVKLLKYLDGRKVTLNHGLAETVEQVEQEGDEFKAKLRPFLDRLVSHFVLDEGKLVVAHAGMKAEMQGRSSGAVREFALYGETTGETDEFGLPIRYPWADDYRGKARVVYGHTPVPVALWHNNTLNVDTGCVFGGKLTALRYPELELVSVDARETYAEPARPMAMNAIGVEETVLDLADVLGRRAVTTRLHGNVTIREENATAALEVMSRFAVSPNWLVYLPPTMSPTETSELPGLLEHPGDAFAAFERFGVQQVICEEKHMGSRTVAIVCRVPEVAARRFQAVGGESGVIYTRTGRRFFSQPSLEEQMLERLQIAADTSGLWEELKTDWMVLDCELMPWSAKAQELLEKQYAPVGASASGSLTVAESVATQAAERLGDPAMAALAERTRARREAVEGYVQAYGQYCWPVTSLADYKLAPFHLLASEGEVHVDKPHTWHMEMLGRLCDGAPDVLMRTPFRVVDLGDDEARTVAVAWWEELTSKGGEGMVVKPLDFVARGDIGLIQPAVKCRGPEYLLIIYGPEYRLPDNLARLRSRGLKGKRSLALREFALGIEALERFVRYESLPRVHECVFGVLALESEPIDPRL